MKGVVAKKTATQLKLADGSRWVIRGGRQVGSGRDSWHASYIYVWDEQEARDRLQESALRRARNVLRTRFTDLNVKHLSAEQIAIINAALDASAMLAERAKK